MQQQDRHPRDRRLAQQAEQQHRVDPVQVEVAVAEPDVQLQRQARPRGRVDAEDRQQRRAHPRGAALRGPRRDLGHDGRVRRHGPVQVEPAAVGDDRLRPHDTRPGVGEARTQRVGVVGGRGAGRDQLLPERLEADDACWHGAPDHALRVSGPVTTSAP